MERLRRIRESGQARSESVSVLRGGYFIKSNFLSKARKQLQLVVPLYTTARTVLRELRERLKAIIPPSPVPAGGQQLVLDLPRPPVFSMQERGMRDKWIKYLLWEEKNPLDLELNSEIGKKEYVNRMKGVYRRAVVKMRFYSEIWYVLASSADQVI